MNISSRKVKSLPVKKCLIFPEWVAGLRLRRRFLHQTVAPPQHAHRGLERLLDQDLSLHGKSRSVRGDASHPNTVKRTTTVKQGFFPAYLRLNAAASAAILRVVGQDVTVRDKSIVSTAGPAIEVERGCDAVEPSALFVSAVLASPVSWLSRLPAAAAGTLVLMVLNLIRVASLFLVKVYYPGAFDTMHLDVWQALFIFMAIVFWAVWASRVSRRRVARPDVSS